MGITIIVDDTEARAKLALLKQRVTQLRPVLEAIGGDLVAGTLLRFKDSVGPTGTPWAALSAVTRARRGNSAKPLLSSGALRNSIAVQSVTDNSVTVGTLVEYAAVQQFGAKKGAFGATRRRAPIPWGNIPARPFMGFSEIDRLTVLETLERYIAAA